MSDFEKWREEQLEAVRKAEKQALRGLHKCRQGPQCCAGWNQRVSQAQQRVQQLENQQTAAALYRERKKR